MGLAAQICSSSTIVPLAPMVERSRVESDAALLKAQILLPLQIKIKMIGSKEDVLIMDVRDSRRFQAWYLETSAEMNRISGIC